MAATTPTLLNRVAARYRHRDPNLVNRELWTGA